MANKFQIKRTSITGRTPNTTNVANTSYIDAGELAVNLTDQKIFTSNGSAYFEVGSNLASLSVQTITANGSAGSNGQVLTSNGSTVYWANSTGGGSNTLATQVSYTFTITSNTTTISGADNNTSVLDYTPGIESVFINGSRQIANVDYIATNTSVVTLTSNVISGDIVQVITFTGANTTVITASRLLPIYTRTSSANVVVNPSSYVTVVGRSSNTNVILTL